MHLLELLQTQRLELALPRNGHCVDQGGKNSGTCGACSWVQNHWATAKSCQHAHHQSINANLEITMLAAAFTNMNSPLATDDDHLGRTDHDVFKAQWISVLRESSQRSPEGISSKAKNS
ncbi:hypothetical protein Agabi119p4_10498 [Agaricus bisporus var. burnettii]|uniref:Uncharacterized protein n=1 Tax=Agaricus bisporus var. burnettii TaxID=192524 RepID=A0A8H7C3S2_AGABI|nr:hypothetical protein Agabi119p4_10498 [Agaricus bisporus var. burnettii]